MSSPELVDRVWAACGRIVAERTRGRGRQPSAKQQLAKLDGDIKLWYRRHDGATGDIEREAAWRRIIELTEQFKQAKQDVAAPVMNPGPQISKAKVAKWLSSISKLVGDGNGKLLIQSLVANHGLTASMADASTMAISLNLALPGQDGLMVPLAEDVLLPGDKITEWVNANQGKHACSCGCGKSIEVIRKHYWKGIPELHRACRHKAMMAKRASLGQGYLNGEQVAKLLGVSPTTVTRWVKTGKLPKPAKSISGMTLFEKKAVEYWTR